MSTVGATAAKVSQALPPKAGHPVAAAKHKPVPAASPSRAASEAKADDHTADARRRGDVPATADTGGVSWSRLGIAAGMAPVAYVNGVILHEAVAHGGMALALGASDVKIKPLPHTYTRDDGTTGFRIAAMSYHPGKDWGDAERTAVLMAPSMLDTAILTGGTVLYETGNWPKSPWASGALFVTQSAAAVDLAFNGFKGMISPNDSGLDTVRAARGLGIHPSVLGGIQTGLAVAGAAELVRIGVDVFSDKPAKPVPKGPTTTVSVSPTLGGGMVGISGTF